MLSTRVIPCLLLKGDGLVKTQKFKDPVYVGDPINVVRIYNEKEVDELIFLDISATPNSRKPNFEKISHIASECFMPICYGGGVRTLEDIRRILKIGVEKVAVNTHALNQPDFIKKSAVEFASSTIVVSIDVKRSFFDNYKVYSNCGKQKTTYNPVEFAKLMEKKGAGEILINSIDRDGTRQGYDLELIESVSSAVSIPVIACGGAGELLDFKQAVEGGGASAVAAGSMFVFSGKRQAVLINYPEYPTLKNLFE